MRSARCALYIVLDLRAGEKTRRKVFSDFCRRHLQLRVPDTYIIYVFVKILICELYMVSFSLVEVTTVKRVYMFIRKH